MRRIILFNRATIEGYFAGTDGNLNWVVPDDEIDKAGADGIANTDTILFGRRTYDQFESFWPGVLAEPAGATDPHTAGRRPPAMKAFATFINNANKVVFSRTRKDVTWNNSRLLREFDPREIESMKKAPGKDMIVFGSGTLASQLTQHGLVDDYIYVVAPVLLGSGKSLFTDVSKSTKLDLTEAKSYPSGNVRLHYTTKRN